MSLLLIILVLVLLFGGGGYAGYRRGYYGGGGIGIVGLILLIVILWLVFGSPYASAADGDTKVSVLPVYQFAEPYILTAFGVVFSALLAWGLAQFQTRTGIHVSDQAKATVQQAATNAAGRILASLEPSAMNMKIDVKSPYIAAEVPKLQASVGDAITKLGMTPERVGDLIAGKIGVLQSAGITPASPVVPQASATAGSLQGG